MIDVSKCEFEESYRDKEQECTVYYFIHPKAMDETEFYSEEDYGNVVFMCLSLTQNDNGECYLQMSPTIDEDDMFSDVDWRDLYIGVNYTEDDIAALLDLARKNKSDMLRG